MAGIGPSAYGNVSTLNVTTSQTILAASIFNSVQINAVAGSVGIYDIDATASAAASNLIAAVSATSTSPLVFNWPLKKGLTLIVHGSATLALTYSTPPGQVIKLGT